jgi:hypothetical protein
VENAQESQGRDVVKCNLGFSDRCCQVCHYVTCVCIGIASGYATHAIEEQTGGCNQFKPSGFKSTHPGWDTTERSTEWNKKVW